MEKQKNNKDVIALLIVIIVILSALCILFATGTINFKTNKINDNTVNENNKQNDNVTDNDESNLLNSNIIVTQNGKVISNEIPSDLVGKYINKNSNDSYIQLTNGNVEVSEPTGSGATSVFKNEQVKLYINYLNINENSEQYVTVEFYIENNGYNQKTTYTYVGEKSSHDDEYHFKTPNPTPVGGAGNNDYPYSKLLLR